ncbi:MAG: TonB family protein [Deltaproteobacteria bacterium]|nr:TonB family protein [Deltaproteobacteria bacterium]
MASSVPPRRKRSSRGPALFGLLVALVVHVPVAVWFVNATWLREVPAPESRPMSVRFMKADKPEEPEEVVEEEEEVQGQIVEIAPPENPERPEEADYLAEYDSTVEEETVDPRFRVDRELTAETFSPDDAIEEVVAEAVDVPTPSTGATSGRRAVFRNGNYSLFPDQQSDWLVANDAGVAAPLPSAASATRYAGSPSNDMLNEAMAERTRLNAREFLYAAFWNRVKQLVSFYADQTLSNARPRVALTRSKYEIGLKGLIDLDGSLHAIEIARSCGIPEFDQALLEAFALAAPFPDPPEGAASADGYIHIEDFVFTIQITAARAEMSGIDPRSQIQFPGLQTTPR